MHSAEIVAKAYREAEASSRLEGMDPCNDAVYQAAKARVIAGEMTPEAMLQAMVDYSRQEAERAGKHVLTGSAA